MSDYKDPPRITVVYALFEQEESRCAIVLA
jgi:hypothetical protein